MRPMVLFLFCLLTMPFIVGYQIDFQDEQNISSPQSGAVLQGTVQIIGFTDVAGFQSSEISFCYSDQPNTWFLIQQSTKPVKNELIATWDTTTIADGSYKLRIEIFLVNGQKAESIVSGLRVRNYTPIETMTPDRESLIKPDSTSTPYLPTATPHPTPTVIPQNPAQIQLSAVFTSLGLGVGVSLFLLIIVILYQGANRRD